MGWVCSTNRSERERKFVFVGRKLGRLRYRKENDIKIDIQGIEWGGVGCGQDCFGSGKRQVTVVVNTITNIRFRQNA